jgi:hypothetical protein
LNDYNKHKSKDKRRKSEKRHHGDGGRHGLERR